MMPPRLVPVSSQILAFGATAVSSAPYPNGATLWVIGDVPFRLAINQEADDRNSIVIYSYLPGVFIVVPAGGYVSVIAHNPSGGPIIANPYGIVLNEVMIS